MSDQESQVTTCVPIIDPIDTVDTTNPPTEDEVWDELRSQSPRYASLAKTDYKNCRLLVENIGDKTDPVKIYPLAGPCRLVHHHYKCTLTFDQTSKTGDPVPANHSTQRVEVVYLNKDHLIRVASAPVQPQISR